MLGATLGCMLKTCTRCGAPKPLDAFYKGEASADGRRQPCKECFKIRHEEYLERSRTSPSEKKCIRCETVKTATDFHKDRVRPDGLCPYCKDCHREYHGRTKHEPVVSEDKQRCSQCKVWKTFTSFYPAHRRRGGAQCKMCLNERSRRKRASDPELRAHIAARIRKWTREHPERARLSGRKSRYGITTEQFEEIQLRAAGKCESCSRPFPSEKQTHIDHCHKTGRIRGLICNACNISLGLMGEDPTRIQALLRYIETRCQTDHVPGSDNPSPDGT